MNDKTGALEKGRAADLFLLHGDARDPYAALAHARPQDVTLTMVGGAPFYGARANLVALGVATPEAINVCGQERAFSGLPKSYKQLVADLTAKLRAHGIMLAPIVDCAR